MRLFGTCLIISFILVSEGKSIANQPPIASATAQPTAGSAPLAVTFTGSGTDPDGTISMYRWSFGDGLTSADPNPTHIYTTTGSYTATFTAIDNNWATSTANVNIKVTVPSTAIPQLMRFQAKLGDTQGSPINGSFDITFRIYDGKTGGSPLWQELQQDISIEDGNLDIELGSAAALNLPFDKQYWLGVEVEADGEMTPRFKLTTVPYSFRSKQ